jgi:hypothetical protein
MAIHLRPAVTRRLLRPTRGLGSAPLPRRRLRADGLRPPIWPCSGWSLPRFTPLADRGRRRHRHCGTGPRLTTDGRYPPPCAAELGLSSRRTPGRPGGEVRPSDRLADASILPRPGDRPGRRAGRPGWTRRAPARRVQPSGRARRVRPLGRRPLGRSPGDSSDRRAAPSAPSSVGSVTGRPRRPASGLATRPSGRLGHGSTRAPVASGTARVPSGDHRVTHGQRPASPASRANPAEPGEPPGRVGFGADGTVGRSGLAGQPADGRRTTEAGPPAWARSMASLASASATVFWARGTWVAVQRRNPPSVPRQAAQSGMSFESLTRQRPETCSTMSFESRSRWTSVAPSSAASSSARTSPVYSATLFVWMPR